MNDATSSLQVFHAVFGTSAPTLQQLRDRCDARGARVLDGAIRLASRRVQAETLQEALHRDLNRAPWSRTSGTTCEAPRPHKGILPDDVLRALVALEPEVISGFIPEPSEEFARQSAWWKSQIEETEDLVEGVELDEAWARRWAIADLQHDTPAVTIEYWVASLSYDTLKGLAPLSEMFAEGLKLDPEFQRELVERSDALVGDLRFKPLEPAYYDRHGGLSAMDVASTLNQGLLLVGEPQSGRTALLEAWLQRVSLGQGPSQLNGMPVFVNPFDDRDREGRIWETAARETGCIVALTPNGRRAFFDSRDEDAIDQPDEVPQRLWDYEPEYTAGAPQTNLIQRLVKLISQPGSKVWLVVVLTRDERELLVRQVPEVAQFEAVEVPDIPDMDRLPIWLCHVMDRPQLGLGQALAIMNAMRPSDVSQAKPWVIEPLLGSALARNLYTPAMLERLQAPSWLRRAIRHIHQGTRPWKKEIFGAKRKFVDRFIGNEARFISLVELDERLHHEGLVGGTSVGNAVDLEESSTTGNMTDFPPSQAPIFMPDETTLQRDLVFVYRSHNEGPTGKRVVYLQGSDVVQWFQMAWEKATATGDAAEWIRRRCQGDVMGLAEALEGADDEGIEIPRTWQELGNALSDYLYCDTAHESVRIDERTLSAHVEQDDEEAAFYFFPKSYIEEHPERCKYLVREDWRLPETHGKGGFTTEIPVHLLGPNASGEGRTYLCLLAYGSERPMTDAEPFAIDGVRLPDLAEHLRTVVPESHIRRATGGEEWYDTWPAEVRLLRAMVGPHDRDFTQALSKCNRFPLDFVLTNTQHTRLGIGPHGRAKDEFLEAASEARGRGRDPAKTLIVTAPHMAQMLLHVSEAQGYQQWIIFDDVWASAHPNLARSVLHFASGWDPLLPSRPGH